VIFKETHLKGVFVIELEKREDSRGFFARSYCWREFSEHGLNPTVVQCNVSCNTARGTLRGMHIQETPHQEAKLVRCTSGAVYDVVIDLRKDSRTRLQHFGVQLDAQNRLMLFVPEGFAHGFITLKDDTEVFYQMSEFYAPENSLGVRWNDPVFQIHWPLEPTTISERDRSYPDYMTEVSAESGEK
jgi:dTDP-4-dehydrorhamnose 3,5-epimerase